MASAGQKADVLMLHLLGRCNLECAHCYMEGSPRRRERLPLDAVLRAVGECRSLGVGSISLTGGEPLLYPDLDRVLTAAAQMPEIKVTVCTNGTLLTTRRAARFREVGLRVNVSIDGRPDFHDRFRQLPGAFAAAEAAFAQLSNLAFRSRSSAAFPKTIWTRSSFWSTGRPGSARTISTRSLCSISAAGGRSPTVV